jgi:nicotinate-nucleotide adenylyltransferase
MDFLRRAAGHPTRLGILPGTFNPVTIAHVALARAARRYCDEVVFVLPRVFPHKEYTGATLEERLQLLDAALESESNFSLAMTEAGLFVEIAAECRQTYGREVRLSFLCGRDAAERIVEWDYGEAGSVAEMLREFDLLVAARGGEYTPPDSLAGGIQPLAVDPEINLVSATEVRTRIAGAGAWEHLVPPAIRPQVRQIYGQGRITAKD